MPSYKIVLRSVAQGADLRLLVDVVCEISKVEANQAVDWLKNLPLTMASHCSEEGARDLSKRLQAVGGLTESLPDSIPVEKKSSFPVKNAEKRSRENAKESSGRAVTLVLISLVLGISVLGILFGGRWILQNTRSPEKIAEELMREGKLEEAGKVLGDGVISGQIKSNLYLARAVALIFQARKRMALQGWASLGMGKNKRRDLPKKGEDLLPLPEANMALVSLDSARVLEPQNPEVYRWTGYLFQQKGMYAEAEENYRKAMALDKKKLVYRNLLAKFYVERENYSKADFLLRGSLQIDSLSLSTLKNLGLLHLSYMGDSLQAARYLWRYHRQNPKGDFDRHTLRTELATVLWNSLNQSPFPPDGQSAMAFAEYENRRKVLQRRLAEDENSRTLEELGILFARRGMHLAAMQYFIRALSLNPEEYTVYRSLAHLQATTGNIEQVAGTLRRAIRNGSEDPFIYGNLAVLEKFYFLESSGDNEKRARKLLRRFLKMSGANNRARIHQLVTTGQI